MSELETRADALAARWAAQAGPNAKYWQPHLARYVVSEVTRLGGDAGAWAFVYALLCHRLRIAL